MEVVHGDAAPAVALGRPERKFTGLEIEGVFVEFPFEPYDCQVRLDALLAGRVVGRGRAMGDLLGTCHG